MKIKNILILPTALWIGVFALLPGRAFAYTTIIVGDVSKAQPWMDQGDALYKNGDYKDAEEAYKNALALTPYYDVAQQDLGRTEAALGNYDLAEQYYRTAIQQRFDSEMTFPIEKVDLTTEYVLVLLRAGAISEAIAIYNEAVNYTKLGRPDAALKTLKTDGSDYNPTEVAAMTHVLKAITANPDDLPTIKSEWDAATKVDPSSAEVNSFTAYMSAKLKEAERQYALEKASNNLPRTPTGMLLVFP